MSTPVRLNKKLSRSEEIEAWILNHAYIFLPLAIAILLILFVALCYAICGVSATDSGVVYNHLEDVI